MVQQNRRADTQPSQESDEYISEKSNIHSYFFRKAGLIPWPLARSKQCEKAEVLVRSKGHVFHTSWLSNKKARYAKSLTLLYIALLTHLSHLDSLCQFD